MKRIVWLLRQLLPLTYRSHFHIEGQHYFAVWRMWLGRTFDMEYLQIAQ